MDDVARTAAHKKRRAAWLKQLYQWHWISSALCLIAMLLFALTGITLNNAGKIEASPRVTARTENLPANLNDQLAAQPATSRAALPGDVRAWLQKQLGVDTAGRDIEWSAREVYVPLPRPGGDAWLNIDRSSGEITYEVTDRGWVAYLNDLHKGRHTGLAWSWFLDLFAVACFVFCITGLLLLQLHSTKRRATWPVVSLGFVIPALLLILLVH